MTELFASRLQRAPRAFDPRAGAEAAAAFRDTGPALAALLAGAAGCSPYLKGLMESEAEWLRAALTKSPEAALAEVIAALRDLPLDALASALRRAKRRVALLTALADLGGVWGLGTVTAALSEFADAAVDLTVRGLVADEIRRGRLPGAEPEDAGTAGGMVVLAMGKLGARELNYSSDIDLICLFDQDRYGADNQAARTAFIRVTRRMAALLSDITAEGYVFRTDLRLRPDAAVTPVCLSMAAAESYYETAGRTWERAAFIKARPCAGDLVAGDRFLRALTPFVWRKYLDFAAIQDAHDMRLRIRDHRGLHGPIAVEGHDLKLGAGGIREIEFFTQTRQLIAGGRDPALREAGTLAGLAALAAKGWVPTAVAAELSQHYAALREVEHRLQMVHDAQTHTIPPTAEGVARIAAFCGQSEPAFRAALLARLSRTSHLAEGFFTPPEAAPAPVLSAQDASIVEGWSRYPALRSERAQAIFRRLRPLLLDRLMQAAHANEALLAFDGFLAGLPAGVQIFSLFEANRSLVDLIVDIAGTAPALARYLARNAAVLDAVIGGAFFAPWPGRPALTRDLARRLAGSADYERRLDAARRWLKEWRFRIGVHHLRGLVTAFEAGRQHADLAAAVLGALWPVVVANFAERYGPPPGRGAVLLGMGSLGAGLLHTDSDLDLILIYDPGQAERSEGPRPLAPRSYYARLTQSLVTALGAPMAEGKLYEVDMRLRPSGRQGPVATSLAAFRAYHEAEAWTWEHLALTRARVIAGDTRLGHRVEALRRRLLVAKGAQDRVRPDVAEMRARLAAAKPGGGPWEARLGPGRLMDIELCAEMLALLCTSPARGVEAQLAAGGTACIVSQTGQTVLMDAFRLCWTVHAGSRLLSDGALDPAALGAGGRAFLLRETGQPTAEALSGVLEQTARAAEAEILGLLAG